MSMFDLSTNTAAQATDNVRDGNFKKATAFVNLSLPREDGSNGKLEAIKLYADREDHAELIKLFQEDPEKAAAALARNLVIDFRLANGPKAGFKLS